MTSGRIPGSTPTRRTVWTVLDLIRWTEDYFRTKGLDSPRLDAEVLLADLLNLDRVRLYLNFDRPLTPGELAGYRERVRRRGGREPVAYILGRKEFHSLELTVGPEVLVPRPETEGLVEAALESVRARWPGEDQIRLLDLGTGSGAVALALAAQEPRIVAWGVDISAPALARAATNARKHQLQARLTFHLGDLYAALPGLTPRFHLITANLPYIPSTAWAEMAPDVKNFEPTVALDGGSDGLAVIRRAIMGAPDHLEKDGILFLELWPTHGPAVIELAGTAGFVRTTVRPDLAGRDRVAVLELAPPDPQETTPMEIPNEAAP